MPDYFDAVESVNEHRGSMSSESGRRDRRMSYSGSFVLAAEAMCSGDESEHDSGSEKSLDESDNNSMTQPPNPLAFPYGSEPVPVTRNEFNTRKTAAHAMMDAALMMANISQLRVLLSAGPHAHYYLPLLLLITASLLFQFVFAILILIIWAKENNKCSKAAKLRKADSDNGSTASLIDRNTWQRQSARGWAPVRPSREPLPSTYLAGMSVRQASDVASDDSDDEGHDAIIQRLHCISVVLVFLITVANMFITGLGLEQTQVIGQWATEQQAAPSTGNVM